MILPPLTQSICIYTFHVQCIAIRDVAFNRWILSAAAAYKGRCPSLSPRGPHNRWSSCREGCRSLERRIAAARRAEVAYWFVKLEPDQGAPGSFNEPCSAL